MRQLLASFRQDPATPGAHLPGEIGFEYWVVRNQFRLGWRVGAAEPELCHLPLQHSTLEALCLQEGFHEFAVFQREIGQRSGLASELLRVFERAFQNEPGDRIDVDRRHLAAEAHRLQRDCAAAGERVEHLWRATVIGFTDLAPEPVEIGPALTPPMQYAAARFAFALFNDHT